MDHFEDITEPQLNTDYSVSGSKIIDFLDCIMDDEGFTGAREQAVTVNNKTVNHQGSLQVRTLVPQSIY
jgi:hypothetical protein